MAVNDLRSRLDALARNFRWVWDPPTQDVFRLIEPRAWEAAHDPVRLVRSAPDDRLAQLAADELFTHRLAAVEEGLARYLSGTPGEPRVAYFCMEHGIAPQLRVYAGGLRALRALGYAPTVFHANEGHAGFLGLERIRELVAAGTPLAGAVDAVRATTVFTTHTAVPAGFDLFDRYLMQRYHAGRGVELDWLMDLGHFPTQ